MYIKILEIVAVITIYEHCCHCATDGLKNNDPKPFQACNENIR